MVSSSNPAMLSRAMRVLVLDDMQERHDGFVIHFAGHEVVSVYRYVECIDALRNKGPWDIVCLDHDLADENPERADCVDRMEGMYSTGVVYMTGLDVAFWLRDNPAFCPRKVLIHSWNPDGAKNMEAVVRGVPGVTVSRQQFRAPVVTIGGAR